MSSGSPNESTASRLERIGRRSDANDRQEIDSDFVEENIGKFYFFCDVISRFFFNQSKQVFFAYLLVFFRQIVTVKNREYLMPMTGKKLILISLRKILVTFIFCDVISRFFCSFKNSQFCLFVIVCPSNRNSKKSLLLLLFLNLSSIFMYETETG